MKRFLTTSLITLALVAGATSAYVPLVHAEDSTFVGDIPLAGDTNSKPGDTSIGSTVPSPAGGDISLPPVSSLPNDSYVASVIIWIMGIFAWLLGVAVVVLDTAVFYTVAQMGDYIKKLNAIGAVWETLRDIGNITLIFGFLAVGITTILNVDWYGGGKKMLPMLLVAAIFINFSLFISEAVIDGGNLFATQFYTQINGGTAAGSKSVVNEGISNAILQNLGLATLYSNALKGTILVKTGNTIFVGFMGSLLFIVTGFVMFSLAFILIARFVALIFLIILAPVGFAGLAVPKLERLAKLWWSTLFGQTITAPILLLLLYIALKIITVPQFLTGFTGTSRPDWTGFLAATPTALNGFAGLFLSFLVAMGLLLAVTIFTKRLSAFGAGWATQTAGKLTFGATAMGMRYTGGFASQWASKKIEKSRIARIPVIGRSVLGVLDRGAKGSFDIRGTKALKSFPGGGVDAGTAQTGGYRKEMEEAIKGREAHAKRLELRGAEEEEKKAHEAAQKAAEREKTRIEAQNEQNMRTLLTQHKVAIQPYSDRVSDARRQLALAQASGNPATISSMQLAFNNELRDYERQRDEQKRESDELKKVHDQLIKVQQDEIAARKGLIVSISQKPQTTYANRLEWGPNKFFYRNTKAAENIRKNAGKSKEEKDVDALMDLLKKAAPPGGAPTAAPTPPPPPVP